MNVATATPATISGEKWFKLSRYGVILSIANKKGKA
jgi:hypothetical protein